MNDTKLELNETHESIKDKTNQEKQISNLEPKKTKIILNDSQISKIGIAMLVVGIFCFIWAFINITLFAKPVVPTNDFAVTTPIFTSKMVNKHVIFSLTANGILFTLLNICFVGLIIAYFVFSFKTFIHNVKEHLANNKSVFISFCVLSCIALFIYLLMFIIAFVPPNLSDLTLGETGKPLESNFNALYNWNTRYETIRNAGYWIFCFLFTVGLLAIIISVSFYFWFKLMQTKYIEIVENVKSKKQQRLQEKEKNKQEKVSLRDYFVQARLAREKAKKEKLANNSLKQNLTDVCVEVDNEIIIEEPEVLIIDQQGSANQNQDYEIPKIKSNDKESPVDKSEPRRLGKLIANMKEKKKNKGTNINKKATVAAPTDEINELVKQLMPD